MIRRLWSMEFLVFGRHVDAFWNDDHNVLWNRLIS
jgi:hypothetical protein